MTMDHAAAAPQLKPKDFKSDIKPVWCPGCGDFAARQPRDSGLDPGLGKFLHFR